MITQINKFLLPLTEDDNEFTDAPYLVWARVCPEVQRSGIALCNHVKIVPPLAIR